MVVWKMPLPRISTWLTKPGPGVWHGPKSLGSLHTGPIIPILHCEVVALACSVVLRRERWRGDVLRRTMPLFWPVFKPWPLPSTV